MHMTAIDNWEAFHAQALAEGFDEALERVWAPNHVNATHSHPFDVEAVVAQGEMWLTHEGRTRHLTPGSTFVVGSGAPHAERYGTAGATIWAARRRSTGPTKS